MLIGEMRDKLVIMYKGKPTKDHRAIRGFHSSGAENSILLGCYTTQPFKKVGFTE